MGAREFLLCDSIYVNQRRGHSRVGMLQYLDKYDRKIILQIGMLITVSIVNIVRCEMLSWTRLRDHGDDNRQAFPMHRPRNDRYHGITFE